MTNIRKSLFYVSILTLGFTAACASTENTTAPAAQSSVQEITAPAPEAMLQKPTDITLDNGQSMMTEVNVDKASQNGFNFFQAEKQSQPEIIVKQDTISGDVVITNTAPSVETEQRALEQAAEIKETIKEEVARDEKPFYHRETIVSRKVSQLEKDLFKVIDFVNSYDEQIEDIQKGSENQAAQYYSLVAAIQSRLQGGSTPGNPILVEQMQGAQKELNSLASSVGELNKLSNEISSNASVASFLLESVRATYNLSGAVKEDHKKLTGIEDKLNATIVRIDRQLNNLSDDVNRRASYLATERRNLQTLALAVANGEPYGQSLARKAYGPVSTLTGVTATSKGSTSPRTARPMANRPMMIIRFDRPKVEYQQAVYLAASETLEKYPDAVFEIVAVTPARGNAAQRALASSDARQNAEDVFRTMVEMGIPSSRVKLAAAQSPSAATTEVHVFLR